MNEQILENLIRGHAARLGQLLEVVMTSMVFNAMVYGASLYAVQVVRTARTTFDYTVALYIIASAMVMAAKGGEMLHRKWGEYAAIERTSESVAGAVKNPSINVSAQSRNSVKIINVLAVAILAGFVVFVAGFQILTQTYLLDAAGRILPPLLVTIYAAWAWAEASK